MKIVLAPSILGVQPDFDGQMPRCSGAACPRWSFARPGHPSVASGRPLCSLTDREPGSVCEPLINEALQHVEWSLLPKPLGPR